MMMSMLRNEEKELQIELARLQIKQSHAMSTQTILLSITFSLMISAVSVYVPLGVMTNNLFYILFAFIYGVVLMFPVLIIVERMRQTQRQLEKQIKDLKKKYLW
jgi:hypothetical protein